MHNRGLGHLLRYGRGSHGGHQWPGKAQRGAVLDQVRYLLHFAGQQGYGRDDVIQMIRDLPD